MRRRFILKVFFDRADVFWSARIIMLAHLAIGLGLTLQATRFARTPAYGNLLVVAPAATWGVLYILSAFSLALWVGTGPREVRWGIASHAVPIALTFGWLLAFVIRYVTDSSTTIVNVVSWSVFLLLLVHSESIVFKEGRAVEEGGNSVPR